MADIYCDRSFSTILTAAFRINESVFVVQIGTNISIIVPLGVLKVCHIALHTANGYDGDFFRKHFPLQASDHPCHVHVVAGLAKRKGNGYH